MILYAEIDGQPVKLSECMWAMWAPCGHIAGMCMAAMSPLAGDKSETVIAATEDEAWKHLEETKSQIARAKREGFRLELMTLTRYRAEFSQLFGNCQHSPEWGVAA